MSTDLTLITIDRLASAYLLLVGPVTDWGRDLTASWLDRLTIDIRDRVVLEPTEGKITIEQVREFQRQAQLMPVASMKRAGVIYAAHLLTGDASHAILKFLEDPPPHLVIILTAEKEDYLLPTIISRCQRWRIQAEKSALLATDPDQRFSYRYLSTRPLHELFQLAEEWGKAEDFLAVFDRLLLNLHQAFRRKELSHRHLTRVMALRQIAKTNVSTRLVAENVFLQLREQQ